MNPYRERNRKRAYELLGNRCAHCGSIDSSKFEVDHIDPSTKSFAIANNWTREWALTLAELEKCQLLCRDCHLEKSRLEGSLVGGQNRWIEIEHGTLHAYCHYGCRCGPCKAAKAEAARASYRRKKNNQSGAVV